MLVLFREASVIGPSSAKLAPTLLVLVLNQSQIDAAELNGLDIVLNIQLPTG